MDFFLHWKIIIESLPAMQSVPDIKLLFLCSLVFLQWSHDAFFSSTVWTWPRPTLEAVSVN